MKEIFTALLITTCLLTSCSNSPEETFDIAALNCNLLYGFAGYELKRDLGSPSEKLVDEKKMTTVPMKRKEVVDNKLKSLEENYEKVKAISINDDNKEMLSASIALYDFTLPVYKKEYYELAALYDENAPAEKIGATEKNITDKYASRFEILYNDVVKKGKLYAEKNGIEVRTVNPSPR